MLPLLYLEKLYITLQRPTRKTIWDLDSKKTDFGDAPNSVVWFGGIFETLFSKSSGQTDNKTHLTAYNIYSTFTLYIEKSISPTNMVYCLCSKNEFQNHISLFENYGTVKCYHSSNYCSSPSPFNHDKNEVVVL